MPTNGLKTKALTVYAAVRLNAEKGYFWIDISSISITLEEAQRKALGTNRTVLNWQSTNNIHHYSQFTLKEKGNRK